MPDSIVSVVFKVAPIVIGLLAWLAERRKKKAAEARAADLRDYEPIEPEGFEAMSSVASWERAVGAGIASVGGVIAVCVVLFVAIDDETSRTVLALTIAALVGVVWWQRRRRDAHETSYGRRRFGPLI